MNRILITGANGFIGRYLAKLLASAGNEVHALVRNIVPSEIEGVSGYHVAPLADQVRLAKVIDDVRPEKVVHLAGITFVQHGDTAEVYNTNLLGSRNLLDALVNSKASVSSVLIASSGYVYSNNGTNALVESSPLAPANHYAVSKLAMEYLSHLYFDSLPITIVRPFNTIGVGQSENFLIPKIIHHIRRKSSFIELGNLDIARDFSDVRTVVKLYSKLLNSSLCARETFNVCSGTAHSLNQVLAMVREISGHDFEVRVNPAFVRQNEVKTLLGSRAKLDAAVGVVPEIALQDTLRWMLEQ
jgi:GDP-6-deoxy-D-talose 4-dehydrogenase